MGDTGAGKTDSIATWVEAGLDTFVLFTEPNGPDSLLASMERRKLPLDRLHWTTVSASAPAWDALEEMASEVNTKSYAALADLKAGIAKNKITGWYRFLSAIKNFHCDRTGEDYGDATEWNDSRCLVIDGLSGMNKMAREYTAGLKPTLHQGEWGIAMSLEENIVFKLCSDRGCFFHLIAHLDRSFSEVEQTTKLTLKALGNKLWPELVKNFSEVILARRGTTANTFHWSNADPNAVLKNRTFPISNNMPPTFVPLVESYRARKASIQLAEPVSASPASASN